MISLEDCVGLCDLSEEEILAIAEHEHLPEMAALAYGNYLLQQKDGAENIFEIIVEDIRAAQARGDRAHTQDLLHVLHHFARHHPDATPDVHPWHKLY